MSRRLVPPQVLVGRGAEQWAKENGIVICDPTALISQRAKKAWEQAHDVIKISKHTDVSYSSDTVGAVSVRFNKTHYFSWYQCLSHLSKGSQIFSYFSLFSPTSIESQFMDLHR